MVSEIPLRSSAFRPIHFSLSPRLESADECLQNYEGKWLVKTYLVKRRLERKGVTVDGARKIYSPHSIFHAERKKKSALLDPRRIFFTWCDLVGGIFGFMDSAVCEGF